MTPKTAAVLATALVAVGLGGSALYVTLTSEADRFAQCRVTQIAGGGADIGGPFTLTSETGQTMTSEQLIQGPTLIYFGYTFCPDVCPIDLSRNAEAIALMEEEGNASVLPAFITIDPERDDVEQVEAYTDFMHDRMIGLTGTQEQVDAAVRAYRVYARKVNAEDEFYLMDHSSFSYLMAPGNELLEVYPSSILPERMAESLSCFTETL